MFRLFKLAMGVDEEKLSREAAYFNQQKNEIRRRFGNAYVAIHNSEVVAFHLDHSIITKRVESLYPGETLLIANAGIDETVEQLSAYI